MKQQAISRQSKSLPQARAHEARSYAIEHNKRSKQPISDRSLRHFLTGVLFVHPLGIVNWTELTFCCAHHGGVLSRDRADDFSVWRTCFGFVAPFPRATPAHSRVGTLRSIRRQGYG